jgi:probable addiction module antidote protein
MTRTHRPHSEAVIELLKDDPALADEYLAVALEEAEQPGGREALLMALRHVAEAQGMAEVAARAGLQRESLYRALSPRGNPTLKTLLAVLSGAGLRLAVERAERARAAA